MKKKQFAFGMVPALAVALVTGGAAQAQYDLFSAEGGFNGGGYATGAVVYDNSVNLLGFLLGLQDEEWGDGVTLAGTNRLVNSISLMIHANGDSGATADITVRIFAGGDDAGATDPGALLWTSDTFLDFAILDSANLYSFAVPNILVPDSFTWTIEMNNVFQAEEGAVGPRFVDPPVIGSSQTGFLWLHNPDATWSAINFGIPNNWGAVVNAVPAPGALALLGLAGLAARRRRRA